VSPRIIAVWEDFLYSKIYYLSLLEICLNLLTMKNAMSNARSQMKIVLITVTVVSNLSLKALAEILLKYQRLRNTDSNKKQTNIVCTRNFQNDTLRNQNENCPATEIGGVILTMRSERKKFFLALRSRYFRIGFFSSISIFDAIQSPIREDQENSTLEIWFLSFWIVLRPLWIKCVRLMPRFLPNLHIQYRIKSQSVSHSIDKIYTMPKSKYPLAARNADMKPTVGHSKIIKQSMMRYLYSNNNPVISWIDINNGIR